MSYESTYNMISMSKNLASSYTIPSKDITLNSLICKSTLNVIGNISSAGDINFQGNLVSDTITSNNFANFSDKRIKYEIKTYDHLNALKQIENLRITTFKKIDDKKNEVNIGFIAQEVDEIIPESIGKMDNYIPDIYQMIDCIYKDDEKEVIFDNKFNLKFRTRLKIIDQNENEFTGTIIDTENNKVVLSLDDNSRFLPSFKNNKTFLYGKNVNDFHFVKKDYIFAVAISATQELSKQIKNQEKIINDLTSRLEKLESNKIVTTEPVKKTRSKKVKL